MTKITIYNEFVHEQIYEGIRKVYPQGIHSCIKSFLEKMASENGEEVLIRTATFEQEEHGLTEEILKDTDVLIYWSHCKQDDFSDDVAKRIQQHVLMGMGFIGLHSAHFSKPMKMLLGTSMTLRWKHDQSEKLWCTCPTHPIAKGVAPCIDLEKEEMYGEFFDIPKPDDVIFTGWFSNGYVFRSGCTFTRGHGKIFYFQPGHEEYPIYSHPEIQKIIFNAVHWCTNRDRLSAPLDCIGV